MSLFLMDSSSLNGELAKESCFQARRKVKVKTISELLSIFTEALDSKKTLTETGDKQLFINHHNYLSITFLFCSGGKKPQIFLYYSWYFPFDSISKTYGGTPFLFLPNLFTMEVHWAQAWGNSWQLGGWNLPALSIQDHTSTASPWVLPEKTSSTSCVILGIGIQCSWVGRSGWRWFASSDHGNEALEIGTSPLGLSQTRRTSHKLGQHPKKSGATPGMFSWEFW